MIVPIASVVAMVDVLIQRISTPSEKYPKDVQKSDEMVEVVKINLRLSAEPKQMSKRLHIVSLAAIKNLRRNSSESLFKKG